MRIVGQRADGYHLLDSVVAFADLGERLALEIADETELVVDGGRDASSPTGAAAVVAEADNLVLRADAAFRARYPGTPPVRYRLTKRIPVAAGLGGGSADAAAALRGLCRIAGIAHSGAIVELAAGLGADVPVCLVSRAARMTGIGESVAPLAGLPALFALIVHPGVALETKRVFAAFDESGPAAAAAGPPDTPFAEVVEGGNDLEAAARALVPVIGETVERIAATEGCLVARMTGSGAACFGLYETQDKADRARAAVAARRPDWWFRAAQLL